MQLSLSVEATRTLRQARNASAFTELALALTAALLSGDVLQVQRAAALWRVLEPRAPLVARAAVFAALLEP